ncbi:pyridoxamine 5'-phosphate oxidase family protein [Streptomyces sp. NA04227]|uniref:pyridoxamine 5'-phosphate oxidase family protein n=1 Tax=Streptomyces sp. NA04227 TaxID=2742136 RepID=UPI0015915BDA|nr:pyridoxamine 5'-phosphate oxidase family protein [Streptomyces sp. NA04227]QKW07704.1 pyridoxamine 5'-phosphate oxidase family protein [Streptomyces sp. NA04227]
MPSHEQRAIQLLSRTAHGRLAASRRAMPFVAAARHIVADGHLMLRMHKGHGYHEACIGSVVAYGTDNAATSAPDAGQWTVQVIGTGEWADPSPEQIGLFGPEPGTVDGDPFEPVYIRLTPQFVTTHSTDNGLERDFARLERRGPHLPGPRPSPENGPADGVA